MEITTRKLSGVGVKAIHDAFIKSHANYYVPVDLTVEQCRSMLKHGNCKLELSVGAFDEDRLIGFIINGFGTWNGKPTAYDNGTGVLPEYRKKGIASRMIDESITTLSENNVSQYLLEVICANTPAYNLYKKKGFEETRKLDCYQSPKDKLSISKKINGDFTIREIDDPDWEVLKAFWDVEPSWQCSIEAVNKVLDKLIVLGIFDNERVAGYCVFSEKGNTVMQFAIDKKYRRKGLFTSLFKHAAEETQSDNIRIVNMCSSCDAFTGFAKSVNLTHNVSQHEMLLDIASVQQGNNQR